MEILILIVHFITDPAISFIAATACVISGLACCWVALTYPKEEQTTVAEKLVASSLVASIVPLLLISPGCIGVFDTICHRCTSNGAFISTAIFMVFTAVIWSLCRSTSKGKLLWLGATSLSTGALVPLLTASLSSIAHCS